MSTSKIVSKKVLITGASGLLGVAAIEKFLSAGWQVVGVSRRKPELPSGRKIDFLSVDLRDEEKARAAFEPLTDITHIATRLCTRSLSWSLAGRARNRSTPTTPCCATWWSQSCTPPPISSTSASCRERRFTACTCTRSLSRPASVMPARITRTSSSTKKPMWARWAPSTASITRLSVLSSFTGPTPGALNVLPAIGVYAAIRRDKGEPFGFPGGPSFVWEAADADLVADVMVWATQSPQAANEAFNITNGDVFEWRNVWPALAETLGVKAGPDMPISLAAYLNDNADVWDRIVVKYDLRSRNLRELVGHGDQHADFAFAYGAPEGPRAFVSTVKLRQAGFTETIDTEVSFRNALQSLIDHKLLPPAAK